MQGLITQLSPWIRNDADVYFNNGNVGIGVTDPDTRLEVLDASNPQLRLTQSDATVYADFQMTSAGNLEINVNGQTNQFVLDAGGNVGIGTSTPITNLHVEANEPRFRLASTALGDLARGRFQLVDSGATVLWEFGYLSSLDSILKIRQRANDDIEISANDIIRMTIKAGGNVGIGTTVPDRLLHPQVSDAVTNVVTYALRLSHISSSIVEAGFGVGVEFELEGEDGTNLVAAAIEAIWTDPATGVEDADLILKVAVAGAVAAD